jgi:hypothetical protein
MAGISDEIFDRRLGKVYTKTGANLMIYGIPSAQYDLLTIPKADWDGKFLVGGKAQALTRTPTQTKQKTDSRHVIQPLFNDFVKSYVKNNPQIPNADKIDMEVHIDDGGRTDTVKPTATLILDEKDLSVTCQVKLTYHRSDMPGSIAMNGCTCEAYVSTQVVTPPVDEDFHFMDDSTEHEITLTFPLATRGNKILIRLLLSNGAGRGPMSVIIEATIPF